MAWTTPITVVTGDVIPASWGNTYVRDNTAWLRGMLDGTGSGTVTVPGSLAIANDANFSFAMASGNPRFNFDASNDYMYYDRSINAWGWFVNNVNKLVLDSNGKLTGSGFYASAITTVANAATVNFAHGLGARPRFIGGYRAAVAGTPSIPIASEFVTGSVCRFTFGDATNISVNNLVGSSQDCIVFAIL